MTSSLRKSFILICNLYVIFIKAVIGNLVNHKFSDKMISLKVPQKLLEVACHDTQFSVQESALNVLRIFCKHDKAKKVIYFLKI